MSERLEGQQESGGVEIEARPVHGETAGEAAAMAVGERVRAVRRAVREHSIESFDAEGDALRKQVAAGGPLRELMLRARLTWAITGRNDAKVDETLGLEPGTCALWRARQVPDGMAWDELANRHGIPDDLQLFEVIGPQSEYDFAAMRIRFSQSMLAKLLQVADEGALYTKEGQRVNFLYDYQGKQVPVGGLPRPRNFGEAAAGLKYVSQVQDAGFEAMRRMADWEGQKEKERGALVDQTLQVVRRAFGDEGVEKFLRVASERGLVRESERQAEVVGAEEEEAEDAAVIEGEVEE